MNRLASDPGPPQAHLCLVPYTHAAISRVLTGDESALDASYEAFIRLPPDHQWRQEFLFRMRVIQVGRKLTGQTPLGQIWTERVESATGDFMYKFRGVFNATYSGYVLGGTVCGVAFVANQLGHGRLRLLEELGAWASAGQDEMLRWPQTPRDRQPDAILIRLIEAVGIEYGRTDPHSRAAVFFGISCLLQNAAKFDDFLWDRLATVLARLNVFMPDEVAQFLGEIQINHREALQVRMDQILPRENVGSLLFFSSERFHALVLSEPSGKKDGIRRGFQDFLRIFLGPLGVSATLRYGARQILQVIRRDDAGPSN